MSWMGFNTSISGMTNSQRKLYTVNHNVSNAQRDGYSRQKVKSSANIPFHVAGQGYVGTGIGVDSVERVRDLYLDKKFRTESASFGNWDMINRSLNEIEGVLRGSDEEGINVNLDEMFKAIEDLSTNPSDMSYRTAFREKAVSFTKTINETVNRLYKQQKDLNSEVKIKIKQVNDYADQIKSLNSEIFAMEVDGSNANDLRDQRDLLIDELSEIVDIQAEETLVNVEETKDGKSIPIKKFEVRIGGMVLVDHNHVSKLKYPPKKIDNPLNPEEPLYQVEWASGGDVKLRSGELKGLLEARDGGQGKDSNGIPYYIDKLDEYARVFADKMNRIHIQGTSLNGIKTIPMFDVPNGAKPSYGEVSVSGETGDIDISRLYVNTDSDTVREEDGKTIKTNTKTYIEVFKNGVLMGNLSSDGKKAIKSDGTEEILNLNIKNTNDEISLVKKTEITETIDGEVQPTVKSSNKLYDFTLKNDNFIIKPSGEGGLNSISIGRDDISFSDDSFKGTQDESGNIYVSREMYVDFIERTIRADDIKVSHEILEDLNNIATIGGNDPTDIENTDILKQIIDAREDPKFFGSDESYQGKPEDYFTSLLSTLGTDNQQAVRMKSIQESILKSATNQKLSVSGVDLNEEMNDMVKFQQIYNASAKMLTTFDQIFDTMINRLGMVGR